MRTLVLALVLSLQGPTLPSLSADAITGRVQLPADQDGLPLRVFAIPADGAASDLSKGALTLAGITETDKTGQFRLTDLPPGRYYIAAGLLAAPTYFPGVAKVSEARPVSFGRGEPVTPLNFTLAPATLDLIHEAKLVPRNPGPIPSTGKKVTAETPLEVRQLLQVEWGSTWWAARVMDFLPDGRVKIHYLGWDSGSDEIVTRSRLQLDDKVVEKTREAAAATAQILSIPPIGGGRVITVQSNPEATEKGLVPANAGPIESTNRAVSATTRLELKQVLQVESGRSWWASRVIDLLPDGQVKIHYLGWDPLFDEVVPRSRLQLDDRAIEKTREAEERSRRLLEPPQPEATEKGLVPANAGPIESTNREVSATTRLELKQVLQVESGRSWWASRVIDLLPDGKVKIHYLGWDPFYDEIVPRSRLQLDERAIEKAREAGEKLTRLLDQQAEVTEKGLVPVNAGPIASTGRAVSATTPLELKQVLQVESGRTWWAARVIDLLPDGRVKIHYLGWSAASDEIVPRSRLQLDDQAIEKTGAKPATRN